MTERPILFSAPMVRAILAGTKTQTRRVVKSHKAFTEWGVKGPDNAYDATVDDAGQGFFLVAGDQGYAGPVPCPYGQPGDRLWVRETWSPDFANHYPNQPAFYAADGHHHIDIETRDGVRGIYSPESRVFVPFKWRPAIHMPRRASRIMLEVTGVRVERLQDITEADAIAEGARRFDDIPVGTPRAYGDLCRWSMESPRDTDECLSTARMAFANLFCKVNGKRVRGAVDFSRWDSNPWVWVVEFRRLP